MHFGLSNNIDKNLNNHPTLVETKRGLPEQNTKRKWRKEKKMFANG